MNLQDFKRLIRPITNKIFLLLGRAVLKAVENSEATQKIQVIALAEETISDIERFQEYGFETYPFAEAQVFIGFLNGNRDHGIALVVHDDRYRPTDLVEGEVAVYTDEDTSDFRIHLKRSRLLYIVNDKADIVSDTEFRVMSPQIALGGPWASVRKLIDSRFKALFDSHVHANGGGVGNSGVPTVAMGDAHMTDYTRGI